MAADAELAGAGLTTCRARRRVGERPEWIANGSSDETRSAAFEEDGGASWAEDDDGPVNTAFRFVVVRKGEGTGEGLPVDRPSWTGDV